MKVCAPSLYNSHRFFGRVVASDSGMAVVVALAVVVILVTAALELHLNQRANLLNAAAMRDRQTLHQMATSGVHLGMAVLIKDRIESQADSLQEDWADEDTMATLVEQIPFDQGSLTVKIIDELGKIQINALVQYPEGVTFNVKQKTHIWDRFAEDMVTIIDLLNLSGADLEETDPDMIIDSIKDWLDSDEEIITGLNGAESDYYEELDPPYACKNGPFDHLSEVRLVRGITPQIFNGFGGAAGLRQYITVYGEIETQDQGFSFPGQININTAELPVLSVLLPSESEDIAERLIEHREAVSGTRYTNDLTNKSWYRNIPGAADITIDPALFSVSSYLFRIVATARLNDAKSVATAVVRRERQSNTTPWRCKVLSWKAE